MKILVCGGRKFEGLHHIERILDPYLKERPHIIHGGANGADTLAGDYAHMNYLVCTVYPAQWPTYGGRAGPLRNQQMLDEGKPDLVIAFPGGAGTADMVRRSKKAGIKTIEVEI